MFYDFNRPHRNMEELQADQVWTDLRTQQARTFVQAYIDTRGDVEFAARLAYAMKDDATTRKSAPGLLQRPAIAAALNFYFKLTPHELAIAELDRTIHKRGIPEATRLRAIEMKMETLGLKKPVTPESEEAPAAPAKMDSARGYEVGDVIDYGDQKIRITKLDENGRPAEGDPVAVAW